MVHKESEHRAIQQLLNGLDDESYSVPKVPVPIDGQNAEIDAVLVYPHFGMSLQKWKLEAAARITFEDTNTDRNIHSWMRDMSGLSC